MRECSSGCSGRWLGTWGGEAGGGEQARVQQRARPSFWPDVQAVFASALAFNRVGPLHAKHNARIPRGIAPHSAMYAVL